MLLQICIKALLDYVRKKYCELIWLKRPVNQNTFFEIIKVVLFLTFLGILEGRAQSRHQALIPIHLFR